MHSAYLCRRFIKWWLLTFPYILHAQVQITFPTSRLVFQRSAANVATIPVAGICPANTSQIRAQLTPRQGGTPTNWLIVDASPNNGTFRGTVTDVTGGWYDLDLRAYSGDTELARVVLERVGVGEVFVTAGQSNSRGVNCASGQATDDRVSMLLYSPDQTGQIQESSLPFTVQHADLSAGTSATGMFPGAYLFMWGALGDQLVNRLGVPVMFYGASYSASNSRHWYKSASGQESFEGYSANMPYRSLGATIQHYLKRTGVRAVLWHQGEGDNYYQSYAEYLNNISYVINKSRTQLGFGNLSWVISRVSYVPAAIGSEYQNHETDPNIIAAQNTLAGQAPNGTGPATDGMIYPDYRRADAPHLHFDADDCPALTSVWNQALSDSYFSAAPPSLPSHPVLLSTGYVFPFSASANQSVSVPYFSQVPARADNQYQVDVLTETGCYLTTLTSGTANPLSVTLPGWANGRYRFRVTATSPVVRGEASEPIAINGSGSGFPPGVTIVRNTSQQNGNWTDERVWSCGHVPTTSEIAEIYHTITLPASYQAQAAGLFYGSGGQLRFSTASLLRLQIATN